MKGEILSIDNSSGIVLGSDEKRYSLESNKTKDGEKLLVGMKIDFTAAFSPEGEGEEKKLIAKDVFILKSESNVSTESKQNGTTAAIGAGLGILNLIPGVGTVFWIVGMVVELFGVKKLADAVNRKDIFDHMLWGTIYGVAGAVMAIIVGFMGFGITAIMGGGDSSFGVGIAIAVILMLFFIIASVVKLYKALAGLGEAYGVGLLKTAAVLYVAGILTIPVFGLGFLILVASMICKIIGYLNIK